MNEPTRSYRCGPAPFKQALETFRSMGGEIDGTPSEGTLRAATPVGRLEGRFLFDGETFSVTITRAPMQAVVDRIWSRLDEICGEPVLPV